MHMGLQEKLRLYAAEHDTHLVAVEGPLTADAVVDAHLAGLAAGKDVTMVTTGAPSPVAARTAARLRIAIVDAATLAEPAPTGPSEAPSAATGVASPVATPAMPPEASSLPLPAATGEASPVVPAVVTELIVATSAPDPVIAHADGPALPWDPATLAPEPAPLVVDPSEAAAMPWSPAYHHELLPAGRERRGEVLTRPTIMGPDWGLPWPRPAPAMDGVAIADPKVWHAGERVRAIREDLERQGAPSFGLAKPEGSAWLKRLSEYGTP